ncbi:MAG: beta-lactamase family protein [Clostridia bacterium]|nr:beta-lactamase family protein [Clostridia bacterium]
MKKLNIELLTENIENRVNADLAAHNICAASLIVNQDGKRVYKRHFGLTFPDRDEAVSDSTVYRLASMTKPIMAVAMLILVDRGLVSLDDPVAKYLPVFEDMSIGEVADGELRFVRKNPTPPTVRNLLTHTSGIGCGFVGDKTFAMMTMDEHATLESAVNAYAKQLLSFEPGTKQEYSPIAAFDVAARIIELLSGKDIESYLQENIFGPCGMTDTTFMPSDEMRARMVCMHTKEADRSWYDTMPDACVFETIPVTHPLGGGGLVSTAEDYSKFAEMLLDGGICGDKRIVSEASVAEMATVQVPLDFHPGPEHWGLGVRVISGEAYEKLPVGTFGWSGAYGTHFWVDPANRITAIYMKNSRHDGGSGAETAANFERDVFASFE